MQSPTGPAEACSDWDSKKMSVGCGLRAPCLSPHSQHTPELRMDQDRPGILHQSRDSESHGDVLNKRMEIPQQRLHPVTGE